MRTQENTAIAGARTLPPRWAAWAAHLTALVVQLPAFLTVGLVRPWGEVVPGWIPVIGGRAVRPMAAVVPAALGAVALTALWANVPWWWTYPHHGMTDTGNLVVGILYQPLVLWGQLLATVTVSYYRRRSPAAAGNGDE
jgi:hypothetical protein